LTILAGIFSRHKDHPVSDTVCEELKPIISRHPKDEILTFKDDRLFLAKVDIGAYGEAGIRIDPAISVSMLAGEPLLALEDGNLYRTRTQDLDLIHDACNHGNWDFLRKAQGVFCSVHYHALEGKLTLIADKLCIRPLYYWVSEKYVVFATAIRILEELSIVPKIMDVRAVAEITSLGYLLGTRTPYANIFLLKAAEIVEFSDKGVSRSQYWRWDQIETSNQPEGELWREAYARFTNSITRRVRSDTSTVAFLSGGLDSRCVVAALRDRNVKVYTFNFSRPGTQDQILGAEFAQKVGLIHRETTWEIEPKWSMMMAAELDERQERSARHVERPRLVWSGDGGSVGVGHVYLSQVIVNLMRDGKLDYAIKAFLNQEKAAIVKGLFRASVGHNLSETLEFGIREELGDIHSDDPGRNFHIFLMLNDQRRHLSNHFEDIDLHRIEFHLPFFDSDFLSSILMCPIDLCLSHRFYVKWLGLFPSAVTSVPWQAYPGHEPCPLPIPKGLGYQWQSDHFIGLQKGKKRDLLHKARKLLKAKDFPHEIMNKEKLRLATWVYHTSLRDYGYVISTAQTIYKYWVLCKGNYVLPN
jgi:asparagine synthase (glutamine-hydrolysing)